MFKAKIGDNIVYCQLTRKTQIDNYILNDNNIEKRSVDNYPPLDVFINLKYQQIAVELNSKVLQPSSIERIVKNLLNSIIKDFSIFVNTIEDRQEFWNYVSEKHEIKEISFDLVVPNFFGATGAAKDLVTEAKEQLNADSVELSIKNKKGNLKATIDSIDSFVKYSATSGGWKLKLKQEGSNKYITVNSTDYCKKKVIEAEIIELVKNMDENAQIGKELYIELLEKLNGLFDYEE